MALRHPEPVAIAPPATGRGASPQQSRAWCAPACFQCSQHYGSFTMNIQRYRRTERGSAAVEMALVAPAVLLLMMGIIEFSLVFFSTLTMQFAVREGARYAITGRTDRDPAAAGQQRYLAVMQTIRNNSMGIFNTVNPSVSVNGKSYASSSTYSANMFGGPGDIVVLRLDCTWPVTTPLISSFFPDGKYKFAVAATMRNEFFE